ncbi:MAG: cytochrome c [Nitrospirae bacterium]|nr:cytochrome c [Nitrospirota bacterium]
MSTLLLKSILSLITILSAFIAIFTMYEILGRSEKKYDIAKLKKIHKANGIVYFLIFIFIAYFCLNFIITSKSELSPRGIFHSVFAFTVIVLLCLKISFIRIYKQFYGKVQTIGLLIALITFGMVGTSGGYYLLVTEFGRDKAFDKIMEYKKEGPSKIADKKVVAPTLRGNRDEGIKIAVKTDPESIRKGKELYESKCYFCHDAYSTKAAVGPGHKGILKNPLLPVSKKPATPENVATQLRNPYKDMPSFSYLSEDDVLNIIAFLNTL